ncbi:MAG: aminotransferase [Proteobacteria bacterium]|nr:aminotransferase [Pseudomonadota bacterium]MBI3498026.1 aminotransferase [Pseudomonadota bacterium]
MSYRLSGLLARVAAPPIPEARRWLAPDRHGPDRPLIDLSQAVPGYPPPKELTRHLALRLDDPQTQRYTDIEGLPALRLALARHMSQCYGARVAAQQVCITAGCNQAFCLALMALAEPGENVLLPVPYYFNHQMWLDMLGIGTVHLPFRPEHGGVPDAAEAARRITPKTRAIVLVSPNNPTGAVYPPDALAAFYSLAKQRNLALVIDETYKDFLPGDDKPHRLFEDPKWSDTLVQLYSFSKVYCLTGYRVGSVIAGGRLLAEIAKAMDCVAICAPHIGQEAALYGLGRLEAWRRANTGLMRERAQALAQSFEGANHGYRLVSLGAYFAYLQHPFEGTPAIDVAKRLAGEQNLLSLPGSMFGPEQERYLRFAFANVPAEAMGHVRKRLEASL